MKKRNPYRAEVVQVGQGACAHGIYLKFYELRIFGGLMKAQKKKSRNDKPFVLAKRLNGDPIERGPKWMTNLRNEINGLDTDNPEKIIALLESHPTLEEGKRKDRCICKPTLNDLGGMK